MIADNRQIRRKFGLFLNLAIVQLDFDVDVEHRDDGGSLSALTVRYLLHENLYTLYYLHSSGVCRSFRSTESSRIRATLLFSFRRCVSNLDRPRLALTWVPNNPTDAIRICSSCYE